MNIEIGTMQDISIHHVKNAKLDLVTKMSSDYVKDKYYTTLTIRTKDNNVVDINIFSSNKDMLKKLTK